MNKFLEKVKSIFSNKSYEEQLYKKYGAINKTKSGNLKILFIADTHGTLHDDKETLDYINENKDKCDICILLGDHSNNDLEIISSIIPKEKMYAILGNHDSWDKLKENNITDINKKVIEINSIRIAGISGSFKYKDTKEYVMYTHEESLEIINSMESADILVSHDKAFLEESNNKTHAGLKGVTKYLYMNKVPLHIHGHIHEETIEKLKNGTISICVYKAKLIDIANLEK